MKWDFQNKLAEYGLTIDSDTLDDQFVLEVKKFLAREEAGTVDTDILAKEDQKLVEMFFDLHDVSEEDTEEIKALKAENEKLAREKAEKEDNERKQAEQKAKKETEEKAKQEAEEKKKKEQEQQAEKERKAAEGKAQAEAEEEKRKNAGWTDQKIDAHLGEIKARKGKIHVDVLKEMNCPKENIGKLFFNWHGFGFNKKIFDRYYYVENQRS